MKSNCNYRTLHNNCIGEISLCTSCGNLKIEIGHLMSLISPEPFRLILEDFKRRYGFYIEQKEANDLILKEEPILICLNSKSLFLKLSFDDFENVLELFEVGGHMLAVKELIRSF